MTTKHANSMKRGGPPADRRAGRQAAGARRTLTSRAPRETSRGGPAFLFHPVAEMFPLIEGPEFDQLVDDMREHGQREPALCVPGDGGELLIVDGRNRKRAADKLGVPLRYELWDGNGSLASLACSLNLRRRHLTQTQRAAAAVGIEAQFAAEARERQRLGGKEKLPAKLPEAGEAREKAARACGVSPRYVSDAKLLHRDAPDLFAAIVRGELTISQAKARHRQEHKRRELQKKAAAVPPAQVSNLWQIVTGDCVAEMERLPRRSRRLIFADPPYNEGIDYGRGKRADMLSDERYLAWCERWMREAAELLTADGSLWVLISERYVARFDVTLNAIGLHRRDWIIWRETFGVHRRDNFGRCARHLLYCVKDPARYVFNEDAALVEGDRAHKYGDKRAARPDGMKIVGNVWDFPRIAGTFGECHNTGTTQLPVGMLHRIVGVASDPGDEVLDPFNGTGTTGVACVELGRRYVGIESNAATAKLARLRLQGVTERSA
jgi:DNA modification methylase